MNQIKLLAKLTFVIDDFKQNQYLYVDDYNGQVYQTLDLKQSPSLTDLYVNKTDYFEEELKPKTYMKVPNEEGEKLVIFHIEKLNIDIKCFYQDKLYTEYNDETKQYEEMRDQNIFYGHEIKLKA